MDRLIYRWRQAECQASVTLRFTLGLVSGSATSCATSVKRAMNRKGRQVPAKVMTGFSRPHQRYSLLGHEATFQRFNVFRIDTGHFSGSSLWIVFVLQALMKLWVR